MSDTTALMKPVAGQVSSEPTRGGQHFVPRVDIFENDDGLVLFADLPGVAPNDVDLRFEKGELILHGRLPAPKPHGQLLYGEYEAGDFYRVFQIHESIDSSRIEAECRNGVLTVHLPKVEQAKPKQVQVRGE